MICPACNGRGEFIYCVETRRDENSVTVEQRKGICRTCNGSGAKPQTNADRIRAMSDEELAKELADCAIGLYCDTRKKGLPELPESVKREVFDSLLEWLKQPAEGE